MNHKTVTPSIWTQIQLSTLFVALYLASVEVSSLICRLRFTPSAITQNPKSHEISTGEESVTEVVDIDARLFLHVINPPMPVRFFIKAVFGYEIRCCKAVYSFCGERPIAKSR